MRAFVLAPPGSGRRSSLRSYSARASGPSPARGRRALSRDSRRRLDPRQLVRVAHDEHVLEFAVLGVGERHRRNDRVAIAQQEAEVAVDRRFLQRSGRPPGVQAARSEEHTSELKSIMHISYAVFRLNKKK